jgi:hypothetical protein
MLSWTLGHRLEGTMPIAYHYDARTTILHLTVEGVVTLEEVRATLLHIAGTPEYGPNLRILSDLRRRDFTNVNSDWFRSVIYMEERTPLPGEPAIAVVVADDFGYGMVRMYQALARSLPQTTMAFHSIEDAEQWLLAKPPPASAATG